MCEKISSGTAKLTEHINNDRARVTEWKITNKGDNTGWHKHEYDYVVIPMFDGLLSIKDGQGVITQAKLQTGISYFRKKGVEHDVINENEFSCSFIEVELIE